MAEKNNNVNLENDVQVIRQILFGEQLEDLFKRMDILEDRLDNLEDRIKEEVKTIKKAARSGGAELREQADRLEGVLTEVQGQAGAEAQSVRKSLNTYKRTVGRRFTRVEKRTEERLAAIQIQQDNLISALAGAFREYLEGPADPADDGSSDG